MNSINVNIPIANLPQVTHHQAEVHRAPMVHQAQNAEIARDRVDLLLRTAKEAEAAEGKIVDPKERREEERRHSKKEQEQGEENEEGGARRDTVAVTMTDSGRLIDLEA